jgi:hypothetical protein
MKPVMTGADEIEIDSRADRLVRLIGKYLAPGWTIKITIDGKDDEGEASAELLNPDMEVIDGPHAITEMIEFSQECHGK